MQKKENMVFNFAVKWYKVFNDENLTVTYPNGNRKEQCGSLFGGVSVGKMDLTEYIRNAIPIEGLAVFDSINFQEE